ncbi:MAG: flagellar basal body-associated FliL family protein [Oligoflexales bacterium]|nr:flagellar basal body-associated FliL family protein [Oligoflexales bacterium]
MAEEKTKEVDAAADGAPKSKKKLFIIIGAAAVVLIGGGAAFFLMSSGGEPAKPSDQISAEDGGEHSSESAVESGHGSDEKDKKEAETKKKSEEGHGTDAAAKGGEKPAEGHGTDAATKKPESAEATHQFGETFNLKPFHLNLGNPIENNYIRLEVAIEFRGGEPQKTEITARQPQLRDAIISVTSRKTREFLLSPDGKDRLRYEMLNQINSLLSQPVENVFITNIIID